MVFYIFERLSLRIIEKQAMMILQLVELFSRRSAVIILCNVRPTSQLNKLTFDILIDDHHL